jgi:hypothetical protein
MELAPAQPLRPARYQFVASHEGMFGGRDYEYIEVVPASAPVTPLGTSDRGTPPAVAAALLPLAATLVALLFAALLLVSLVRRPAVQKALWAAGFVLFAVAAACEAVAQRAGWSEGLFKTYYTAGGVLTVALLESGSAWLLLRGRARDVLLGGLLVAAVAAVVTAALAHVDAAALAAALDNRPPSNSLLHGHAFLWAIALNSYGTLFLVGGALLSVLRRQRVRTNVWIGAGALVVALATGLSRAGSYSFVYAGELLGMSMTFFGFHLAGAPPRRKPSAEVERAAAIAPAP